jgi:hypothetical protein
MALPVIICDSPFDMAISADVVGDYLEDDPVVIDIARAQTNRCCQDLLSIVAPTKSDRFSIVRYRIEFLHRSVKDFLQQSPTVSEKLGRLAGSGFSAARTLFACYVYLVKSSTEDDTKLWSTEALLQLAIIGDEYDTSAARLLQELDKAMQVIWSRGNKHWTNSDETNFDYHNRVFSIGLKERYLSELGQRDLLGHLIELNLFHPVRAAMMTNLPAKQYRPYLDYALRHSSDAPHKRSRPKGFWLQSSGDPEMVGLLLGMGCDVNEHIYEYSGRTVWDLYLAFLFQQDIKSERHRKTTWLLINHGAKPISTCLVVREPPWKRLELPMEQILSRAFGVEEAEKMCERIAKNEAGWWSWLTVRKPRLGNGA